MRNYYPKRSEQWTISRERYAELRSFCLQYPRWKVELTDTAFISSPKLDGMPRGSDVSDPTARAAERRDILLRKIELVDRCAKAPENGAWFKALILNVCNGMGYEAIRDLYPETLKTNFKFKFFDARRAFFILLDKEKE